MLAGNQKKYFDAEIAASLQEEQSLTATFRISANMLNLDPRKLATDALQQVWALNQKLELLKIAFEVSLSLLPVAKCSDKST